jgi:hypothetical protein
MKTVLLILSLSLCKFAFCQNWVSLGSTGIEFMYFKDNKDSILFFKKDSAAIGIPLTFSSDFYQLLSQDKKSFDLITDNCSHFDVIFISDTLDAIFNGSGTKKVVFFTERKIKKKSDGTELWFMTNLSGQVEPCWPQLHLRRFHNKSINKIKLLSVEPGACQI